jgi:hypothetical protein
VLRRPSAVAPAKVAAGKTCFVVTGRSPTRPEPEDSSTSPPNRRSSLRRRRVIAHDFVKARGEFGDHPLFQFIVEARVVVVPHGSA